MPDLPAPTAPPADPSDPLASLHKMSTTAGLASRDYVAVNTAAVIAALLGLASSLALFANILLVIPAAGIIVSIVAFRQVANSNRTETGKGLAAAGFLLSALLAAGVITMQVLEASHSREDAKQVDQLMQSLGAAVAGDHLQQAYELFDTPFRDRVSPREFVDTFRIIARGDAVNGKLRGLRWNGVPPAYEKIASGTNVWSDAIIEFEHNENQRLRLACRKIGDRWYIHDAPAIFPARAKPQMKWPGKQE